MLGTDVHFNHQVLAEVISGNVAAEARKLGISRQHLNNILKGNRNPSGSLLLRIQATYDLPFQKLAKRAS